MEIAVVVLDSVNENEAKQSTIWLKKECLKPAYQEIFVIQ
jgi:hypothetical protein